MILIVPVVFVVRKISYVALSLITLLAGETDTPVSAAADTGFKILNKEEPGVIVKTSTISAKLNEILKTLEESFILLF